MNNCVLIGRLARDPETKYKDEMAITRFTLAVDRVGKDKGADFLRIVAFGKQAENCERYLSKGSQVAIQGSIQTGSYEKQDGTKVYTTDIIANRVEFLSGGGEKKESAAIPDGFHALDDDEDMGIPF